MKKGKLILLVGASGSGKDSILEGAKALDSRYEKLITYTTRKPRDGEANGIDYHFTDKETLDMMCKVANMEIPQEVHGNYYSYSYTTINEKIKNGANVVFIVDLENAMNLKDIYPNESKLIYVTPPNEDVLRERLMNRGTEDSVSFERRMSDAIEEIRRVFYNKSVDRFIVNDDLDKTVKQFMDCVEEKR